MSAEVAPIVTAERPGWWARTKTWLQRFFRRLAYLLGPIVLTGLLWLLVRWVTNPAFAQEVTVAGSASLFGLGTTVVFGKTVLQDISLGVWQLALIVMWVNAASTFWYTYNIDLLERMPKIGPSLQRMRTDAKETLKDRPWIRRLSVVGVGAFVVTPLPGSGALGGAVVGRLIGVSKFATFMSVSIAGVIVSAGYAFFADWLRVRVEDVPTWIRIGGAVVVFGLIFLLMRWFTKLSTKKSTPEESETNDQAMVEPVEKVTPPTPVAASADE